MCDKSVEPEIREFLQRENSMKIGAGKERKTRKQQKCGELFLWQLRVLKKDDIFMQMYYGSEVLLVATAVDNLCSISNLCSITTKFPRQLPVTDKDICRDVKAIKQLEADVDEDADDEDQKISVFKCLTFSFFLLACEPVDSYKIQRYQ